MKRESGKRVFSGRERRIIWIIILVSLILGCIRFIHWRKDLSILERGAVISSSEVSKG